MQEDVKRRGISGMLSAAKLMTIAMTVAGASVLQASTTFSDGTFNLNNYTISTYQTGGATINISQKLTGGDPGANLDISTSVPAGVGESLNSRSYVVNKTFLYHPSTMGAVSSIGVSAEVDRLFTGDVPSLVGFSPGVYQDGKYYAYYTIPGSYAPGVYQLASATLLPNQFDLVTDLATGAIDTSLHPNLAGDPFQLGFSSSVVSTGVAEAFTADIRYDNLTFNLNTATPEPSATASLGFALIVLGLGLKSRLRRKEAGI